MNRHHFVFDVESIGLHGEGFAFGAVVVDDSGRELSASSTACDPADAAGSNWSEWGDRAWVAQHVPRLAARAAAPNRMRSAFFHALEAARASAREAGATLLVWAECGWPVEARFLADACDDARGRQEVGPYPLHEIATAMLLAGMDPMATYDRLPAELPRHDPLADARQSARLLVEALGRLRLCAAPDLRWDDDGARRAEPGSEQRRVVDLPPMVVVSGGVGAPLPGEIADRAAYETALASGRIVELSDLDATTPRNTEAVH